MNQTEDFVKRLIVKLLRDRISFETLSTGSSLQELGLDSLAMIELVNEIEESFGISVSDEELLNQEEWMQNVGSIVMFIDAKTKTAVG